MKQDQVNQLIDKGLLVSPDLEEQEITQEVIINTTDEQLILNQDLNQLLFKKNVEADWKQFEKALFNKEKNQDSRTYDAFLEFIRKHEQETPTIQQLPDSPVKIVFSEEEEPSKIAVDNFVSYFNARFKMIESFIKAREEMAGVTSISRVLQKKSKETSSIIAMIVNKQETKNNNIILTVEDQTGSINILISKSKQELFALGKDCVLDDIIGISGTSGNKILFANSITLPDIPVVRGMKKTKHEVYAAFLGDPHYGSKEFLKKEFESFLNFISGEAGTPQQKEMAKKIKYLFVTGDLVEGVGIYPGQEEDLEIMEVTNQYKGLAKLFMRIPEHIHIIICPGNHDAGRIAEPQLKIPIDFARPIYERKNTYVVSNPAMINIESEKGFPGFDVLIYHGYSFIYYAENVESIKKAGGQKRPDLIMKFLLTRRHLAPTHASNLYVPYKNRDPLLIKKVPDFFVSGHIHRVGVANYRGVTLVNCSCWTDITEDQEKRGLEPQPGKLPIINLQTRDVKIMNFYKQDKN